MGKDCDPLTGETRTEQLRRILIFDFRALGYTNVESVVHAALSYDELHQIRVQVLADRHPDIALGSYLDSAPYLTPHHPSGRSGPRSGRSTSGHGRFTEQQGSYNG